MENVDWIHDDYASNISVDYNNDLDIRDLSIDGIEVEIEEGERNK